MALSNTNKLLKVAQRLNSQAVRHNNALQREKKLAGREETVYEYASKNAKRPNYVFVWGHATTGALGEHFNTTAW